MVLEERFMALSDTRIHQIELLLTLDYLLRYTDEKHPATQQDICRHATKYGLKYDSKAKSGNDVRRQRIAECLKFLMEVTTKYAEDVPFVLETTSSGKYYIDQKNYLSEEQIIKILAAVQNDKYTQDEDTEFLIERLLDSLSNVYNRERYKEELNKLNKGVKKYNLSTNRKIRLVNKAFNNGKMIKIRYEIYGKNKADLHVYDFWYRVYKIKEYKNKPYAILIPINTGDLIFFKGFIFDTIENLNIPRGSDKEVLCDDFEDNRDLDKLFKEKSRWLTKYYDSPEEMLEESKMPINGIAFKTSFYFKKVFLKFVKPSFEEFFSTNMELEGCTSFDINKEEEVGRKNKKNFITVHPLKENEEAEYYVVNTFIDPEAFLSWLVSDVHGDGVATISDMVVVVGPSLINKRLYAFYLGHAKKMMKYLSNEEIEKVDKNTDRFIKKGEEV